MSVRYGNLTHLVPVCDITFLFLQLCAVMGLLWCNTYPRYPRYRIVSYHHFFMCFMEPELPSQIPSCSTIISCFQWLSGPQYLWQQRSESRDHPLHVQVHFYTYTYYWIQPDSVRCSGINSLFFIDAKVDVKLCERALSKHWKKNRSFTVFGLLQCFNGFTLNLDFHQRFIIKCF